LRRDARAARARVRLAVVGDGPVARARRDFAAGVFIAGGFEIDPDARAVCLCPSDEALADRSVAACLPGLGSAPFIALAAPPGPDADGLGRVTTPPVVLLHRAADQRAALRQMLAAWEVA
jgi:hypothetical protein